MDLKVLIQEIHLLTSHIYKSISIIYVLIIDPHSDQLPVGLTAQLVKHCTSIAKPLIQAFLDEQRICIYTFLVSKGTVVLLRWRNETKILILSNELIKIELRPSKNWKLNHSLHEGLWNLSFPNQCYGGNSTVINSFNKTKIRQKKRTAHNKNPLFLRHWDSESELFPTRFILERVSRNLSYNNNQIANERTVLTTDASQSADLRMRLWQ